MRVLIFGAGSAGRFLYDEIEEKTRNIQVVAFLDNYLDGEYRKVPIVRPDTLLADTAGYDAVFIAAGAQKTIRVAINTVRGYRKREIYMLHDSAGKNRISPFDAEGRILPGLLRKIRFSEEKPTLHYFEVPVTDRCNLNCKGCLFACNVEAQGEHIPYEQIEKDALRMRELIYDVPWIRILGGEPLMHPDIEHILALYRRTFADSEIDLCTNGLLIPKMPEEYFRVLADNRITIHISGYPPTFHMLEQIGSILKGYHLNYTLLRRDSFSKYYTLEKRSDAGRNFEMCGASGCLEVYNGRLIRCSAVIAFEKFNQQFKTSYETKEGGDWFSIHKPDINAWDVKKMLDVASDACAYCDMERMEQFEWTHGGAVSRLEDYIL